MNKKIFTIILNYQSAEDTVRCINSLREQENVDMTIVVVDNSESQQHEDELLAKIDKKVSCSPYIYNQACSEIVNDPEQEKILQSSVRNERIVLILGSQNKGYSSGNNIGIRYALARGATAIFIVNPDVIFTDKNTAVVLFEKLFSNEKCLVIGPRVVDQEGQNQNPMWELSFLQEFLQPVRDRVKKLFCNQKSAGRKKLQGGHEPYPVEKLVGCCLMIKSSFLRQCSLLDENVFLYCEEPILASKAKLAGGGVFYCPGTEVQHHHEEKKGSSANYRYFIQSRMYYLRNYKGYNWLQLFLLKASHYALYILKVGKEKFRLG